MILINSTKNQELHDYYRGSDKYYILTADEIKECLKSFYLNYPESYRYLRLRKVYYTVKPTKKIGF